MSLMIPYTVERRGDSGVNNVTLGIWLFLASEVMLFGALFSCYPLIRTAATSWPRGGELLNVTIGAVNTVVLLTLTFVAFRSRRLALSKGRVAFGLASVLALVFLAFKGVEYASEISHGLVPSHSTFMATYFTLTGIHALHVIGGIIANVWVMRAVGRVDDRLAAGRIRVVSLYWLFVDVVWWVIFGLLYVW